MKNNIKLVLLTIIILTSSCKKNIELTNNKNYNEVVNNAKKTEDKCIKLLTELVKKSSIKTPFINDFSLLIETIEENKITLKLYVNSGIQQNTIGWLIIDNENNKLLDITNDIENPISLKYDENLWNQVAECYFRVKKENKNSTNTSECIDNISDYESQQICTFENTIIEKVYKNTIKNKEITNTENLLKKLPKKDTLININENGLISLSYSIINPKKINIEFLFEGGVNTLILEQNDTEVKRIFTTSAD